MQTPLVHIGYPKTASTWLQKRLLPLRDDLLLLRRATPGAEWIESAATDAVADFDPARARAQFEACRATAPERIPIVSYEAFVGDPFGAGLSPVELARRVRAILPGARVALVVREPVRLLESLYRQYVQIGGLERVAVALDGGPGSPAVLSREFLYFDRVREIWAEAFGADSLEVFVYEELLENPRAFVERFLAFAGAAATGASLPPAGANRGTTGLALEALRFGNRFAQSRFNPNPLLPAGWVRQRSLRRLLQRGVSPLLGTRSGEVRVFDASTRAELREHFRPHNAALAAAAGLDLARYGYAL